MGAVERQRGRVQPDSSRPWQTQYLARPAGAEVDRNPLGDPADRDWAVRGYSAHLLTIAHRQPAEDLPSAASRPLSQRAQEAGAKRPLPQRRTGRCGCQAKRGPR